jgi:hypothetical protein
MFHYTPLGLSSSMRGSSSPGYICTDQPSPPPPGPSSTMRSFNSLLQPETTPRPRGSFSDCPWTGVFWCYIFQTNKESRETIGLAVSQTCTQQGLNIYMFKNCGVAAHGPTTCNNLRLKPSERVNSLQARGQFPGRCADVPIGPCMCCLQLSVLHCLQFISRCRRPGHRCQQYKCYFYDNFIFTFGI